MTMIAASDQQRRRSQRRLEGLRGALEGAKQRGGRMELRRQGGDGVDRLAERHAGREIERQRHRRKHALVIDRQRLHLVALVRHRRKRHLRAVASPAT